MTSINNLAIKSVNAFVLVCFPISERSFKDLLSCESKHAHELRWHRMRYGGALQRRENAVSAFPQIAPIFEASLKQLLVVAASCRVVSTPRPPGYAFRGLAVPDAAFRQEIMP
jgi:hypothetical protein